MENIRYIGGSPLLSSFSWLHHHPMIKNFENDDDKDVILTRFNKKKGGSHYEKQSG